MDHNRILPCGCIKASLGRQELNGIVREAAEEGKLLASPALRSWGGAQTLGRGGGRYQPAILGAV